MYTYLVAYHLYGDDDPFNITVNADDKFGAWYRAIDTSDLSIHLGQVKSITVTFVA